MKIQLYQATVSSEYYPLITDINLGWPITREQAVKIKNTDHFSITQSPEGAAELAKAMRQHLTEAALWIEAPYIEERLCAFTMTTLQKLEQFDDNAYIPLDIECTNNDIKTIISVEQLLQKMYDANGQIKNTVLLGDAGAGKSTVIRRLYRELAKSYLSKDTNSVFPLLIRLNQYPKDPIQSVLTEMALSTSQKIHLMSSKKIIIILDGVDEISSEEFVLSIRTVQTSADNVSFLLTCKTKYFDQNTHIVHDIVSEIRSQSIILQPPNYQQLKAMQSLFLKCNSMALSSTEEHYIENQYKNRKLTPLYLKMLMSTLPQIKANDHFQGLFHTRAHLLSYELKQRSKKYQIEETTLRGFAEQLAVQLYLYNFIKSGSNKLPWMEESIDFIILTQYARFDTDFIIKTLQLQKNKNGLNFNHHSYQEYYFARVIWQEISQREPMLINSNLNKMELCYQHDLLAFIADMYHDYVFESSTADGSAKNRYQIQQKLHTCVALAKNNPDYRILAANALSILCACHDVRLQLPSDFSDIHLAKVNFTGANLSGIDFSGAIADLALLDEAQLENAILPSNWFLDSRVIPAAYYRHLQRLNDGSIIVTQRTNDDKPEFDFIDLHNPSRRFTKPKLQIPNMPPKGRGDHIQFAVLHASGEYHAVYSQNTQQCGENRRYSAYDHYTLQIYRQDLVLNTYLRWDNLNVEPLKFIGFHPDQPIIFGLHYLRSEKGKNICFSLSVFDPEEEKPYRIDDVCCALAKFVIHPTHKYLLYVMEANNRQEIFESKMSRGVGLIHVDRYKEALQVIPFSQITGVESHTDTHIIDIATFYTKPYFVIATRAGLIVTLYVYDFLHNRLLAQHAVSDRSFNNLVVNTNDENIAFSLTKDIKIWYYQLDFVETAYKHISGDQQLFFTDNRLFLLDRTPNQRALYTINTTFLLEKSISSSLHTHAISFILQHPTLPILAMIGNDYKISLLDSRTGRCLKQASLPELHYPYLCFSEDGQFCITNSQTAIYLFDIYSSEVMEFFIPQPSDVNRQNNIYTYMLNPGDGNQLIVFTLLNIDKSPMFIFDLTTRQFESHAIFNIDSVTVTAAASHASYGVNIIATEQNRHRPAIICLEYLNKPRLYVSLPSDNIKFTSALKIDPSNAVFAARFADKGLIVIYDLETGSICYQLQHKLCFSDNHRVHDFDFAPYSEYLVSIQEERIMTFWQRDKLLYRIVVSGDVRNNISSVCWTREDLVYVGDISGNLFCFDTSGIRYNERPALVWTTAADVTLLRHNSTTSQPNLYADFTP